MSILSTIFKAKRYIKTDNGYQLFSEWQKASEVEFNNGSDAETTLGAINGITSSLNTNNDNYALSAAGGYNLQSQVTKLNTNFTNKLNGCVLKHDAITLTSNELVNTFKECCAQLKSKEKGIYMFEFLITGVDRVQMIITWSNDVNTSHGMIQTYNKAIFINASEARFIEIERVQ